VTKFNDNFEHLLESYPTSVRIVKREFYPKNFKLSENFVKVFKDEYKRLIDEGHDKRNALRKINKALFFHTRA